MLICIERHCIIVHILPKPGTPPGQEAYFGYVCILHSTSPCQKENELMERRRKRKKKGRERREGGKGRGETKERREKEK